MDILEKTKVDQRKGRFQLFCCLFGLAMIWLVVLPRISAVPSVSAKLKQIRCKGIYGNALFYTELPALEQILHRLERPPK